MPGTTNQKGHLLQIRSTQEVGYSGPDVVTAKGTMDTGAPASFPGSEDRMPVAKGFNMQPDIGRQQPQSVVSEHLSWKAVQGSEAPGGQWAGAGGEDIGNSIGDHQPMSGVVQKNRPPF